MRFTERCPSVAEQRALSAPRRARPSLLRGRGHRDRLSGRPTQHRRM